MAEVVTTQAVTTSVSGPNTEWSPSEAGVYSVLVTFDAAPDPGDSIDVFWYLTLEGADPRRVPWSITVDETTDVTEAFLSPPVPLSDTVWDELRSDATVAGVIGWRFQIIKVADLEV